MTSTPEIPIDAGATRHPGKLLVGLIALGWIYALAQVLTLETPGSLAEIGPGMEIFALAKAQLFGDPFAFESSFSFCASNTGNWSVWDVFKAMAMWLGMICAMMLPVLLLFRWPATGENAVLGIAGYIAAWLPFCAAAVALQWALQNAGLLSAHAVLQHTGLGVAILLVVASAYFYQYAYPAEVPDRRVARVTSFRAGLILGKRCLLCCGPLMLVMFVIGLMNVVGMLALTLVMVLSMLAQSRKLPLLLGSVALGWAGFVAMA